MPAPPDHSSPDVTPDTIGFAVKFRAGTGDPPVREPETPREPPVEEPGPEPVPEVDPEPRPPEIDPNPGKPPVRAAGAS